MQAAKSLRLLLFLVPALILFIAAIFALTGRNMPRGAAKNEFSQYDIFFLRNGELWKHDTNGAHKISQGKEYTHFFGISQDGSLWLGTLQPPAQSEESAYLEHNTLILTSFDPLENKERFAATFPDVTDVVYQRAPGRFVLFGPTQALPNPDEGWKIEVTVLNDDAEKIATFSEPNLFNTRGIDGGTTAFHELSDGTLLALKKSFTVDSYRTYLELTPSGARKERRLRFPRDIDQLHWYKNKPIVQVPARSGRSPSIARLLPDGNTKAIFDIPNLITMNDLFDAFGKTYIVGIIDSDQKDWPPCSRLYKITTETQIPVIGSVAGVWPTPDRALLYAEPLEQCGHVRLWKTDVNGQNARLVADDLIIQNYYQQPIIVPRD